MSQWTHVVGSIKLSSSITEEVVNTTTGELNYSIPKPEQQFKLSVPQAAPVPFTKINKFKPGLVFTVAEYSLPRCQPIIKTAMEMLPSGESEIINYNTHQSKNKFRVHSSGLSDFEEPIFEQRMIDYFNNAEYGEDLGPYTYEEIKNYFNPTVDWVRKALEFSLTITDDIRDCSGEDLMLSLNKAIIYLLRHKIFIVDGVVEWSDEYNSNIYYKFEAHNNYNFCIIDAKTGTKLAQKTIEVDYDEDNNEVQINSVFSDTWLDYISEGSEDEEN